MTQFILVRCVYADDFEQSVNERLEDGWDLHGHCAISPGSYVQPMTREKPYRIAPPAAPPDCGEPVSPERAKALFEVMRASVGAVSE